MLRTDYKNWNLHDAELKEIKYIWDKHEVNVKGKAFILNMKNTVDCEIVIKNVKDIHIPHNCPWGDSNYINHLNVKECEDSVLFEIEMLSGDYIHIIGASITLSYQELNTKKTLSQLYNGKILENNYGSSLSKNCCELFNCKPIDDYIIKDLRVMISQKIGLEHLVPFAIEELEFNIFCEGEFYPGDLLKAVLSIEEEWWKENREYKERLENAIINQMKSFNAILKNFD